MPKISLREKPEKLTKERLRRELKKHGVALPDSQALKAEYVKLYKRKILSKKSAGFSSDEEDLKQGTKIKRSSAKDPVLNELSVKLEKIDFTKNMTVDGVDVSEFSDQQLRDELRMRGIDIGPIGPTTRKLYERKLEKLLQDGGTGDATVNNEDEYSDHDSSDDDEEENLEIMERVAVETRNKRRSLLQSANKDGSVTRRRAMRSVPDPPAEEKKVVEETPAPLNVDEPARPSRRWMPVWIQILIVAALITFAYLVMMSMESNPPKRIPG